MTRATVAVTTISGARSAGQLVRLEVVLIEPLVLEFPGLDEKGADSESDLESARFTLHRVKLRANLRALASPHEI